MDRGSWAATPLAMPNSADIESSAGAIMEEEIGAPTVKIEMNNVTAHFRLFDPGTGQ